MKHFSDEDEDHGDEYNDKEDDESPSVTRSNLTHSLYRRTAYVTRICAHVTDTAAVAVFLNSQNSVKLTIIRTLDYRDLILAVHA